MLYCILVESRWAANNPSAFLFLYITFKEDYMTLHKEKNFYKLILTLAVPIIIQSLITSSLNLVDNVMIGTLGENEIAAVGLANQYFFIFMMTMTGITGGTSIFLSQYHGKGDNKSIKNFMGITFVISIIVAAIFALLAFFAPVFVMKIFTKDTTVINLGVSYLKTVSLSYIFTIVTLTFSIALRSTGQASLPMVGSIIGILSNAGFNYIFIFGKLGLPAMGVRGAALGTTFSRLLEMIFVVSLIYIKDYSVKCRLKELFFTKHQFKSFIKTATPVIFNDIMWSLGISAYSVAYAKVGTNALASMQIAITINNLFNIFGTGLASATAIIIGNKIGESKKELAIEYTHKISKIAIVLGIIIGSALILTSPQIVKLFNITAETKAITLTVLKIMAVITPLRFFNITMIIGAFRGGGDVNYAIFAELICVWGIAVPLSFIGAALLHLNIIWVYVLVCFEEIVKLFFELPRFKSNKWIKEVI